MGRKDKLATVDRKSFQEVRAQARCDIRERYSVGQRWLCLEEAVKSEDRRRKEFYDRMEESLTRTLPPIVSKFLRTLKRSVRLTMLRVGGTPYSIVRGMFLHWDQDHSGNLCINELARCVRSLGVEMNRDELQQVMEFYSDGNDAMSYSQLLKDLKKDEPGMLVAVTDDLYKDVDAASRFRTRDDIAMAKPACIEPFLAALRDVISMKLRNEGGTPESHLRSAFLRSDSSYSNALKVADFTRAMRVEMGLDMSDEHAAQIVAWYDRAKKNEVDYKMILVDLCKDMPGLMTHVELTADQVKSNNLGLKNNCFVPKPFTAAPNRSLEFVKSKIRESVHSMVLLRGGTLRSWIKEAFSTWDPRCTGFIEGWEGVKGAVKRLGVTISADDARTILRLYDKNGRGCMNYELMITDIVNGELESPYADAPPSALMKTVYRKGNIPGDPSQTDHAGVTSRSPPAINCSLRRIGSAVDVYARKSRGQLEAKDILLGSCIRFDSHGDGRIDAGKFVDILKLLKVRGCSRSDIDALVTWFDTNGSHQLDYHELIKQLYGQQGSNHINVLTRSIPDIAGKPNNATTATMPTTKLLFDKYSTLDNEGGLATLETKKTLDTKMKNTRFIQTPSEKKRLEVARRRELLTYRADVVNRLQNVEQQRITLLGKLNRPNTVG